MQFWTKFMIFWMDEKCHLGWHICCIPNHQFKK